jgi:hypothetical protein
MVIVPANSPASAGYSIARSIRTRASASANLSQTITTSATWALSVWVKRGVLSAISPIFGDGVKFLANDTLTAGSLTTTAVYRDPSSWYHVYVSNLGLYINGVLIGAVTTSALTNPRIASNGTNYFDGELAEFNFINGATPAVTAFGSFDAVTGVWKPARYSGSYPTGSSYLPFTDNSALTTSSNVGLGKDFSGNGNYWTTNNISITAGVTYDSMTDVPTLTSATAANFAVLNPLNPSRSTLTNGNLTASGTTDTPTIIPTSGTWYFEIDGVSKTWTPPAAFPAAAGNYNFGQRPFTNTPTGTLLNTFNLPTSTIVKGNSVMDATLYSGNSSTQNIVNAAGFKPDLVWPKARSVAYNNTLYDSVRGATKTLFPNLTNAEVTEANTLTAFNSNGFSLGSEVRTNESGNTYVAWQWQAGQGSTSSNTNGTITSTVSVNASAGFSIVTYTGNGTNGATVGHGLGVAPAFFVVKTRGVVGNWQAYHSALTGTTAILLDSTGAAFASSAYWNNTNPTSSVFSLGTSSFVNVASQTQVAYCWTPIAGYSAFGSYTGNGSTDGSFVYTGFKPRWVLIKHTTVANNWILIDSARNEYNLAGSRLMPNASDAEANDNGLDILSNGFKLRSTNGATNTSGGVYIYAAFATNPFRNSLAQ